MTQNKDIFNLNEILDWVKKGEVELPSVQRGFVWKPSQIENLWDSLLRGYPAGSFVLSKSLNNTSKLQLLDGQQRATSICLGCYDLSMLKDQPASEYGQNIFKASLKNIRVFIDLQKPDKDDNRKYVFRVITKSHPWGYQRTDNTKTLISENIRKAMNEAYKVEDYLKSDLDNFWPYDAGYPIPINMFINAKDEEDLGNKLKEWEKTIKKEKKSDYYNSNEIYEAVNSMLKNQRFPALYLDFEKLQNDTPYLPLNSNDLKQTEGDIDEGNQNDEENSKTDEIENLFIRLNAGGTPLRGEDLNYSILKANIDSTLQTSIENACEGIFKPARFITIAYRLFQNKQEGKTSDSLQMKIKPKQFQRTMSQKQVKFVEFVNEVINKPINNTTNMPLLKYVRSVLEYNNSTEIKDDYRLPYLISSRIGNTAPEVMFLLLHRILIKEDRFEFNSDLHRKMLGIITLFAWLGKGEQRDHSKLLNNVWPASEKLSAGEFWSSSIVQRAKIEYHNTAVLTDFPAYKELKKIIEEKTKDGTDKRNMILDKFKEEYHSFIRTIFFNKDLILYAQRKILSEWFDIEFFNLDDTNVPFDWDHISPHKFIYHKPGIPKAITSFYNSNGNFRAWPYSLNRKDQEGVPAKKLDPLNTENYDEENNAWKEIIKKYNYKFDCPKELKDILLKWSFCNEYWLNHNVEDLKNGNWKFVYKLILQRNLELYKEWYDELKINDLIPDENGKNNDIFKKECWFNKTAIQDKSIKKYFDEYKDNECCFHKIKEKEMSLYFCWDNEDEDNKNSILFPSLKENNIEFGLYANDFKGFDIPKDSTKYIFDSNFLFGNFTLISCDKESYVTLFTEIKNWIAELDKELSQSFTKSLSQKLQEEIN